MFQDLKAETQQVLDKLWAEKRIPFKLNVGKVTEGMTEYTIHFYDSRMHFANCPQVEGLSFSEMVRTAVLSAVNRLGGPLTRTDYGSQIRAGQSSDI